jgi:hypothetical protein
VADPPFTDGDRVTGAELGTGIPTLLVATTLTAATGNVILAVPAGWNRLKAYFSGTSTGATAASSCKVQFNGDTGANYSFIFTQSNNGTTSTADNTGQTAIQIATITGATSTANYAGSGSLVIDNVSAGTFFPVVVCTATTFVTTTNMYNGVYSGQWSSLAAITSINFVLGTGTWSIGSQFSLYGLL